MNTMTEVLWSNEQDGRITCQAHGGHYLACAIDSKPKAKSHKTPLGKWVIMDTDEVAYFTAEVGVAPSCETCGSK